MFISISFLLLVIDTTMAVVFFFIFHFIGTTVNVYFYIFPFISYWYNNGCLFPNMMTVFIAVDKCTQQNSCLQVSI